MPMKPVQIYAMRALALQVLVANGETDSETAQELRSQMKANWEQLSPRQQELIQHLHQDLEWALKARPTPYLTPEDPTVLSDYYNQKTLPGMIKALHRIPTPDLAAHKRLTLMSQMWGDLIGPWLGDVFLGAAARVKNEQRRSALRREADRELLRQGMTAWSNGKLSAMLSALDAVGITYTVSDGDVYLDGSDGEPAALTLTAEGRVGTRVYPIDEVPDVLLSL